MVNSIYGARLCTNLDHPGLCIEVKSGGASTSEAIDQCARVGSRVIYINRKFNKLARGATTEEDTGKQGPETIEYRSC